MASRLCLAVAFFLAFPGLICSQSMNSGISGTVTDPSGAVISKAELTLTSVDRQTNSKTTTGSDGLYSFPNLQPGRYELKIVAPGFKPITQTGISLLVNQNARLDLALEVGTQVQSVEVQANASPLNFENAVHQEGVSPETITNLPLEVSGSPRNSAQMAVLLPGVSTGTSSSAYDSRINGGLKEGDEAVMDGVSMQEGTMSQSGMVAFWDFRMTPDMISEFRVMTSTYSPEYGDSTGAQIIVTTNSGTDQFHGAGFEYLRNKSLNATQFTNNRQPGDQRPKDNEHDFGGKLGGPIKIPKLYNGSRFRTFFFLDLEYYRINGGASRPTRSIPSLQERTGNFSDWPYPIYDPSTTQLNPNFNASQPVGPNNLQYLRAPFQGNIIPATKLASSLAQGWFKFLPTPTSPGPLNNYLVPNPVPDTILSNSNYYLGKLDQYFGEKDHLSVTIWRQVIPAKFVSELPIQIASETFSDPQNAWVNRLNWDHTFSPTLLNHFAIGYLNRNEGYGSVDYQYANDIPQIKGVPNHGYPPQITFNHNNNSPYAQFGNNTGLNSEDVTSRPTYIANDLVTWVAGRHTFKFGGEVRRPMQNIHNGGNGSGTFDFEPTQTGLPGIAGSGNPIASFLLGAVDNSSVQLISVGTKYVRQHAIALFAGDTWKVTNKLSLDLGFRWETFSPTREKYNNASFFDFGPNPDAGNRPGRLAFAGPSWGIATLGPPYTEENWHGGIAPRAGIAYSINNKTVVRTGYGIFYTQAFYPGWGGGLSQFGLNETANANSTAFGGIDPAFYLQNGFPISQIQQPPIISAGAANGTDGQLTYRPKDANRLSYSQQWNFTIERQLSGNAMFSIAYVGSKGTRLPSQLLPLNVLNPSLLSMGGKLNDQFGPNSTSVDGVPAPYPGWAQQLLSKGGCAPTVAQALVPYPQFCDALFGTNENVSNSTYNSLQTKLEKRFSHGLYALVSYTWSKLITDSGGLTQTSQFSNGSLSRGVISPFEYHRNKAISQDDVPHNFSTAVVYDLPLGKGKRWLNSGGFSNVILGGWQVTSTIRYASGLPLLFRSNSCNVPSQFRVACIPGVLPGANPFAQSKDDFNPNARLFSAAAFQSANSFNFYYGTGERVTNYRGFPYKNIDIGIGKRTPLTERVNFLLRAEMFNAFNNHYFVCGSQIRGYCSPFNTDISSPDFGVWNGSVTAPRNIQLVGRVEF
jgi:hypothetical protein